MAQSICSHRPRWLGFCEWMFHRCDGWRRRERFRAMRFRRWGSGRTIDSCWWKFSSGLGRKHLILLESKTEDGAVFAVDPLLAWGSI